MDSARTRSPEPPNDLRYMIDASNLSSNIHVLADIPNSSNCLSVAVSPDGKAYAVSLANGMVNAYLARNEKLIYTCNKREKNHSCSATSLRFRPWGKGDVNPNNLILATFTNGKVKTFHYPSGECVHQFNEHRELLTCEYSQVGDTFATSGNDGVLNVYDDETRAKLISYSPPFYENARFRRIYSIAYHTQSVDELVTGGWDGVVRYYDLRISHMIKQFYGPYICGEGLAIDPTGRELCTASWRMKDSLQLWDYGSGQLIKNISIPTSRSLEEYESSGRRGKRRSMSIMSLPRISSSISSPSRTSFTQNMDSVNLLQLPHMLYCCRYFLSGDFIVFSGSNHNSVAVINKYSNEIVAAVSGLRNSVYCIGAYGPKLAVISGEHVGLVKAFLNYA
ncbi:unnamed protein product [Allacma fusca]|uniref:Uncharacterized protein n=1 Tax=Allacma fusca TaxID=39272 RepID=A0A8J2KHA1_9HEXA|nr:unnamed protein product [Allacma fusca]